MTEHRVTPLLYRYVLYLQGTTTPPAKSNYFIFTKPSIYFSCYFTHTIDGHKIGAPKELFRRYPPLATFIPSVFRACLKDMEDQGNIKSELHPILLMLSRVQPIMGDDSAISGEFVPLLFRCIGCKDHGIRRVAARSLVNLSSGKTNTDVISACKMHIEKLSCQSKYYDWNLLDGILYVIYSLNESSSSATNSLLDTKMQKSLIEIMNSISFPPPCRSCALKILLSCSISCESDKIGVCHACEEISKCKVVGSMIGGR